MSDGQQIEDVSKVVVESNNTYRNGIAWTALYLLVLGLILVTNPDWFKDFNANKFGDLLAGVFAPVAFLWLVLGFVQQGRELRAQVHELRQAVEVSTKQTEQFQKTNRFQVRQVRLATYESGLKDLNLLLSEYVEILNRTFGSHVPIVRQDNLWNRVAQGNTGALLVYVDELLGSLISAQAWRLVNPVAMHRNGLFDRSKAFSEACLDFTQELRLIDSEAGVAFRLKQKQLLRVLNKNAEFATAVAEFADAFAKQTKEQT